MRKLIQAALVAVLLVPNVALPESASITLIPERYGPVQVELVDGAAGNCWTNLAEARSYAEDQLRMLGYTVGSDTQGKFYISVNSNRLDNGTCYGGIKIQVYQAEFEGGMLEILEVASGGNTFVGQDNANTLVLDQIEMLIDVMR